ncbi:hypothetical protein H0H92_012899 [Tricholoma furcatifolium]|nr:hypothetical protein H0H92_012899 [Tricholoma furcatifolium]
MSFDNCEKMDIRDSEMTHISGDQYIGENLTIHHHRERWHAIWPEQSTHNAESTKRGRQGSLDSADAYLSVDNDSTPRETQWLPMKKRPRHITTSAELSEAMGSMHDISMTHIRDNINANYLQINTYMGSQHNYCGHESDVYNLDMSDHDLFKTNPVLQSNIHETSSSFASANTLPFLFTPALPPEPGCMIGRDEQLSAVIATLLQPPARIAILGGGGMGKTTLALAILHHPAVVERYSSRYFVSCEGISLLSSLVEKIANALHIPLANRDASLIDTILSSFSKDSILCLDNLETIWDKESLRRDLEDLLSHLQLQVLGFMITMRGTQYPSKNMFFFTCGLELMDKFVEKLLIAVDGIPLAISLMSAMFSDYTASEGHDVIPSELENAHTVLIKAWRQGKGSLMLANASVVFTAWSEYLGNPVEDVLSAAIEYGIDIPDVNGDCHYGLGQVYLFYEKFNVARKLFEDAAELHRQAYNVCKEGNDIRLVGVIYWRQNNLHKAEELFKRASKLHQEAHSVLEEEKDIYYLGIVCVSQSNMNEAEKKFKASLDLFRKTSNILWQGNSVHQLGMMFLNQKKFDLAAASFKQASELHKKAHNILWQAHDLNGLGRVYLSANKLDKAEELFKNAVELHKQVQDVGWEAEDLYWMGLVYVAQNNLDAAEAQFENAFNLFKQTCNIGWQGNSLHQLGLAYLNQTKFDLAEASFKQALELHKEIHNVLWQANDNNRLGRVYLSANKLDKAEELFKNAVELHKQVQDVGWEAEDLYWMGLVYVAQNNLDAAEAQFENAFNLFKQTCNIGWQGNSLHQLGLAYLNQTKFDLAEASFKQAVKLHKQVHNVSWEANDINRLGHVYLKKHKLEQAEQSFQYAAELYGQVQDVEQEEANNVFHLGLVYLQLNKLHEAKISLQNALTLFKKINNIIWQAHILHHLGHINVQENQFNIAEAFFQDAAQFYHQLLLKPSVLFHRQDYSTLEIANNMQCLGDVQLKQKHFVAAEESFHNAAKYYQQACNLPGQVYATEKLEEIYHYYKNPDVAKEFFEYAAALRKKVKHIHS